MEIDLTKFAAERKALEEERINVLARLAALELVIARWDPDGATNQTLDAFPQRVGMREAIQKATAQGPLGIHELVAAMKSEGFIFKSRNPVGSVSAYLYHSRGKKYFKRVKDGFVAR